MGLSLAFMAGEIIVLYLLWDAHHVVGRTLNAVTFESIIASFGWGSAALNQPSLVIVLAFEAGLLLVAANTGFLGGPAVLANMALDSWMPYQFRNLSSRLVTQNGLILVAGGVVALITAGNVAVLVVLYSINVFLIFTLSLAGLVRYRWRHRRSRPTGRRDPRRAARLCGRQAAAHARSAGGGVHRREESQRTHSRVANGVESVARLLQELPRHQSIDSRRSQLRRRQGARGN